MLDNIFRSVYCEVYRLTDVFSTFLDKIAFHDFDQQQNSTNKPNYLRFDKYKIRSEEYSVKRWNKYKNCFLFVLTVTISCSFFWVSFFNSFRWDFHIILVVFNKFKTRTFTSCGFWWFLWFLIRGKIGDKVKSWIQLFLKFIKNEPSVCHWTFNFLAIRWLIGTNY